MNEIRQELGYYQVNITLFTGSKYLERKGGSTVVAYICMVYGVMKTRSSNSVCAPLFLVLAMYLHIFMVETDFYITGKI